MHIKFFSTMGAVPWGGSEILWYETAKWLINQGIKISVSTHGWSNTPMPVADLRKAGISLWERNKKVQPSRLERNLIRLRLKPWRNIYDDFLVAWLKENNPDLVVISDGAIADPFYLKRCAELNIPYVTISQANSVQHWPDDSSAALFAELLPKAECNFFVSYENLKLCELQIGCCLPKAEVVRNPFGVRYDVTPNWPIDSEMELNLACVARLDPTAKGQDLLFQVLSMKKWAKRSVGVVCYGDGVRENCLRRLVEQLGIDDKVQFMGHVSHIEKIWLKHHALVLPSRYEGLPLAAVEAMLCHRPVIATRVSGNPEIIDDGNTGFLASAPTVESLDEALERAWQQRSELRFMGERAGRSIRNLVPPDPVQVFGERLLEIASSLKK